MEQDGVIDILIVISTRNQDLGLVDWTKKTVATGMDLAELRLDKLPLYIIATSQISGSIEPLNRIVALVVFATDHPQPVS